MMDVYYRYELTSDRLSMILDGKIFWNVGIYTKDLETNFIGFSCYVL